MKTFIYKYDDLFSPTLKAMHELGGSASVSEIESKVADILKLSEEEINDIHRGSITKLSYRLAWARNYLKRYGLLDNSSRGVWSLTVKGLKTFTVDKALVNREVKGIDIKEKKIGVGVKKINKGIEEIAWKEELLDIIKKMHPEKFERLCQRMLRELGFINVEVTGRTGDGGIDGKGVVRIGGVLSFHVVFQSKRHKSNISPSIIRDFRGAMQGRADKGLLITTAAFTNEAKREAQRDGATPIDLIDGYQFAENLKMLGLGIEIVTIEQVKINNEWFANF